MGCGDADSRIHDKKAVPKPEEPMVNLISSQAVSSLEG